MAGNISNYQIGSMIDRAYKDTSTRKVPKYFAVGINQVNTIGKTATGLDVQVPIYNGTVNDDGSNTLTGSSAGDNSTDNTTTYKQGAGVTDATAQNLIKDDSNVLATWTITLTNNIDTTKPFSLWLYVQDSEVLAKISEYKIKLATDSSNYYEFNTTTLVTGWNYITSNKVNVEDLTEIGTVGTISSLIIDITTNNATDEFSAGEVVYDLLRQWSSSDLYKEFESGFPSTNLTNLEAQFRCKLGTILANGFLLNSFAIFDEDYNYMSGDKFNDSYSKSDKDILTFNAYDRDKGNCI